MRALRILGLATAGFGALSLAKPQIPARLLGQTDASGEPQSGAVMTAHVAGVRDLLSGLSLLLLPAGKARAAAVVTRVAFDVGDGLLLPRSVADPRMQRALRAGAFGFAGACALAGMASGVRSHRSARAAD